MEYFCEKLSIKIELLKFLFGWRMYTIDEAKFGHIWFEISDIKNNMANVSKTFM